MHLTPDDTWKGNVIRGMCKAKPEATLTARMCRHEKSFAVSDNEYLQYHADKDNLPDRGELGQDLKGK